MQIANLVHRKIWQFAPPRRIQFSICNLLFVAFIVSCPVRALAEDVLELTSGAKVRGTLLSRTEKEVQIEMVVSGKALTRKFPLKSIAAIVRNGKREELAAAAPSAKPMPSDLGAAGNGNPPPNPAADEKRSKAQIDAMIEKIGKTQPDWYEATPLNYPQSLDLTWPEPAPGGWNNQKNMGQYIWDIINPNPGKWQEGVKLMHHLLAVNKDNRDVQRRVMNSIGRMYHDLLSDYARAAFWWRQAGVDKSGEFPNSGVHLAECYWKLGSKQMAVELLGKLKPHVHMVKLWADMGETDKALQLAEGVVRGGAPEIAYLDAGDACRLAGKFPQALSFYQKVLDLPAAGQGKGRVERQQNRARASMEAIKLFELCDVKKIADGAYKASSLGYEGQIEVEVVVANKRIESVRVTDHKEKQFYNALDETPKRIIAKQGVKGVDATSSATITSEAIINATAKALGGAK